MNELSERVPPFQFAEEPGPHAVGVKVVEQYDHTRVFRYLTDELGKPTQGVRSRPLQTLIWYPAQSGPGTPVTVGDYVSLWRTETTFGCPRFPARAKEWRAAMDRALESPLWAIRDAPEAAGRFPLVIYAPSFSSVSWENADLCEYLASHGYVVISTPSMGAVTRQMTADVAGASAQAADISFLIAYARGLPNAYTSQVAAAGFSWGGLSNLFAAARDSRVRALIALDGSLRYWPGTVRQAGDIHPRNMTIPLIAFAKTEWTLEEQAHYLTPAQLRGPNVLNSWVHGDLVTVHMLGMTHRQFSSMFQRNEEVWRDFHDPQFPDRQRGDYGRADGMTSYGCVCRYTLQFLNATLKQDAAAKAYLQRPPAENGAPKHFMDVTYRAAKGIPASCEALHAAVGRQGFDSVIQIYEEMRRDDPEIQLEEASIASWAEELIDAGCLSEATKLLRLNVQMFPDSSTAYSSLARALWLNGQLQAALENYRAALEKNSINPDAIRALRELGPRTKGA